MFKVQFSRCQSFWIMCILVFWGYKTFSFFLFLFITIVPTVIMHYDSDGWDNFEELIPQATTLLTQWLRSIRRDCRRGCPRVMCLPTRVVCQRGFWSAITMYYCKNVTNKWRPKSFTTSCLYTNLVSPAPRASSWQSRSLKVSALTLTKKKNFTHTHRDIHTYTQI